MPRGAEPPRAPTSGVDEPEGELDGEADPDGGRSGGERSGQPVAGIEAGRTPPAGALVGIVGVHGVGLVDPAEALGESDGAPGSGAPVWGVAEAETLWSLGMSATIGVPAGRPARGPAPSGEGDTGAVGDTGP